MPSSRVAPDVAEKLSKLGDTPKEFDWVSKGAVSSVKDQVICSWEIISQIMAVLIKSEGQISSRILYEDKNYLNSN